MYVKEATNEQLQIIYNLLDTGDYKQIEQIIDEYTNSIINNKDFKKFGENGGFGGNPGSSNSIHPTNEKINTEEMDSQSFELYCIFMLIDKYLKEQDENKKQLLQNEIQMALNEYRKKDEFVPSRSR